MGGGENTARGGRGWGLGRLMGGLWRALQLSSPCWCLTAAHVHVYVGIEQGVHVKSLPPPPTFSLTCFVYAYVY